MKQKQKQKQKNKNSKSESKTEQKDPKNETKSQDSNDKKTKVDFKNLSISEEFALIEESKKKHEELIENESWCLINFSWYKQWVEYIEQKDQEDVENLKYPKPGKIDNSPLFEKNKLKRDLKENEDYTLVHKETSKLFQEIYGDMEKISKKVIKIGKKKHQKIVEIYNLTFYIHCLEDGKLKKKATVHLSRSLKHLDLFDLIANTWKVPIKKVRIYILNQGKIGKEIKNKKKFLYSSRLEDFEKVFFEIKGYKEPPRVSKKKKKNKKNKSSSSDNDHDHDHDPDSDPQQTKFSVLKVWKKKSQQKNQLNKYSGLVGLNNLGNTCFMNSSLQCLLNTIVIRDYFLTNKYSKEINKKNKIGMGGKLAKAFAELEQNYWTTRSSSISPRNLKFVIGRFASQFMGFSQQDSHELLSFLLDGLHEDLNRIKKKPYIQDIDGKNCKDLPKLARDSWKNYKKRNDSFIVDHFEGLLRNRLECPKCKTVSYKFDPCRYLSVPLPSSLEFSLAVTLIPVNKQKKMFKYYITIQKTLGLDGVLTELSTLTGIETNRLCLAEIYNNNIYKIFTSDNAFFKISKKDIIVAFEFPETPKDKKDSKDIKDTKDSKATKNTKNKKDTKNTKNKEDDEDKEDKEELYYVPMNYQIMKFNKFRCAGIPELFRFPLKSKMNYESFYSLCTERLFNCIPELLEKTEKLEKELSKKSNQSDKSDLNSESSKNGKEKTEEDTGEGSESGKGEGSESGMEKGNKKKKEKKDDKEKNNKKNEKKKNNKKLSKEEKAIIKQGFQLNELYPFFRIVTIHKRKRKAQTITLLDENSEISIKDNIRIYLRFNPYLLQKFPKILDPLSEIEPHSSLKKYQKSLKKGKFSSQTSLSKCIDCFLTTEKLSKENTWYCSDCKEHVQAWKKFDIWELPNVLIIQLKRFTQSRYSRRKIDKYVEFPEILDMCDYLIGPNKNSKKYKYKLYAVSNHYGGVGGGHYTAFGKSHSTQKWYSYNDSRCSRVNGSDAVKTSAAYVLFYQKINPQENNNEKDEESKKNENGNGNGNGVEKDKDKKTEKKNQKNDKDKKKEKKKKDKKKEKDNQEKENKNKKDEGSNNKKKKKDEKGNEKSEKDKDKKTEKNDQKNDKEKKKEKKKKYKTKEKDNQEEENKNKKDEGSNNEKDEESKKDEKENEKSEKDKDKKTEKNDQKDDKEKKKEKKKKDKKKEKDNQEEETKSKNDDKKMKEENEKKGKEQEKDDDKDNNSDEEENEANK
ncbi:ubiquitin carboxyl-terminal hydrolase [Anaeramoeba flamelloides]|uniref:ubiquitinyl hydrolase 1 n=1 Tax=Anaeramoeba flamelloides TaxID=1746091 RepID=A0AAV7Y658_9EUKA|nr:ubiquitin carboxyl-terminal hydrolase [Anaeramoeba flamelloides]